jgi:SH3-like domain-containing protein
VEQLASDNTLQRSGVEILGEIRDRLPLSPGVYRSTERLRIRREPELDAEVLRILDAGEQIHVEEVRGAWVRVRLIGEPDGWASAKHLTQSG